MVEEECPEPKDGEVRVRVLAAGVAYPDLLMREGVHPEKPPLPFTPGWDLIGVVDRPGMGVSGIEPGQMIAALPISGAYAGSSSACPNVNSFRYHLGWTPPRLSASC